MTIASYIATEALLIGDKQKRGNGVRNHFGKNADLTTTPCPSIPRRLTQRVELIVSRKRRRVPFSTMNTACLCVDARRQAGPTTRPAHLYFRITKDGNLVVAISPHALAFWGRGRK